MEIRELGGKGLQTLLEIPSGDAKRQMMMTGLEQQRRQATAGLDKRRVNGFRSFDGALSRQVGFVCL